VQRDGRRGEEAEQVVKDRMRIIMRAWPGISSIAGRSTASLHSNR
jgi:hypothetical protein